MLKETVCWTALRSMLSDSSTSTYFDGVADGWLQVDLGELYDITAIGYAPRGGYEYRMTDGMFKASADGTNWTTLYTVKSKPSSGLVSMRWSVTVSSGSLNNLPVSTKPISAGFSNMIAHDAIQP